ncbi:MAG TPA: protein kinase [bacterium]
MLLTSGARLGPYEIVAPLGAGGMGEVYRALDPRLGREVAIKVMPRAVASSPDRLARFEREARTVAGLNHPNIVVLHSIEEAAGVRFLTMELIEGQDLASYIAPGGLPVARLLDVAIPIADALAAAHEKGVVHRDLKPGNVMVTRDRRVKVLDFGLAKLTKADPDPRLASAVTMVSPISDTADVIGTLPYMAPEQVRREAVDPRTDLFSFGVLVYELATGRRPFTGRTLADVSSAILRDAPPPLASVRADLPGDLERIVGRCLEKHPRDRFQTALDLGNDLRGLRRTLERGAQAGPPGPRDVASIAVMPFVNMSHDEKNEYFSDGLATELINVLTRIPGLRVAARSSAFTFKGKSATIGEMGRALNVASVLDGSVRKAGNRVRISVQLVKVSDGDHLWSETYDRTLEDIFAVQDDIARSVVKELRTTLLGEDADSKASGEARADVAQATKGRGGSAEAHRLVLLARHLGDRLAREDMDKGIGYLEEALRLDPGYALAWAELGQACTGMTGRGWLPVAEGYGRARAAAQRALELEPDLGEGHALMGWLQMHHDRDWEGGERSLRRALEHAPGNALVLRWAGVLASLRGRFDEAIELFRRSLEHDPLSPSAYINLGLACHAAGRLDESIEAYGKALEISPERAVARSYFALALADERRDGEALAVAAREPAEEHRLFSLAVVHHAAGRAAESDRALAALVERHADSMAYQIAEVYAGRGDVDRAFEWLERAYAAQDPGLSELNLSPRLRALHGDPRWAALRARMGFPG